MRYVPDKERVRRWVESSRRAQGLPPTIGDMAFYAQLARILRTAETLRLSEERSTRVRSADDSDLLALTMNDAGPRFPLSRSRRPRAHPATEKGQSPTP